MHRALIEPCTELYIEPCAGLYIEPCAGLYIEPCAKPRADLQTFVLVINCRDVCRDNCMGNYIDV